MTLASDTDTTLDEARVDRALRCVIQLIDYDTHKNLERDEETGQDNYPEHVGVFIEAYDDGHEQTFPGPEGQTVADVDAAKNAVRTVLTEAFDRANPPSPAELADLVVEHLLKAGARFPGGSVDLSAR